MQSRAAVVRDTGRLGGGALKQAGCTTRRAAYRVCIISTIHYPTPSSLASPRLPHSRRTESLLLLTGAFD